MSTLRISQESLQFTRRAQPQDTAPAPNTTEPPAKLHLFNSAVAEAYGLNVAVIYQYLSWHCRKFGQWTGSKGKLLTVFPYLTAKELRQALPRLLGTAEGYPALVNRCPSGYGCVYTLARRSRKGDLHAFDPKMAAQYGILAAIVYDNVVYWISHEDTSGEEEPTHYVSPASWQKIHPYASLRSVKRAFQTLRLAGELVVAARKNGRIPAWTIPLGIGKLNRWRGLHKQVKHDVVNKVDHTEYVYVPMISDPDLC